MLEIICKSVAVELTLDAVSGTACSVSVGISALDHESGNYAVESKSVVESF